MPSQGFSKLCYKRAFDSGEGMGRGWEWGSEDVRPYCARCVSSLCIEIIIYRQSDVLGVIRTNYVDGVDRSLVGFTKKHVDKAEWTEKKVDVGQIIK